MTSEVEVRVHPSGDPSFPREHELAWRIAEVAADPVAVEADVAEMVANRVIDNAAVAIAALRRSPVAAARAQAQSRPQAGPEAQSRPQAGPRAQSRPQPQTTPDALGLRPRTGATVVGLPGGTRITPEWAAWANGVAVRELDFHDTFLSAEYSHPGDNIPPILAVAQHTGASGADLVRGIATGYEVQVDLARAISLHRHTIDHVAHLGPSAAAGIGTLLGLPVETIYHAIGQALHTTTATRQSRKGLISTWKAYAPAFAGKQAIEAVDRAMRGQTSPAPIYEGEDAVIATLLDGPEASYPVPLPASGEPKRAILDTFTKEHSAEYQAQAWIDLARRLGREHPELRDPDEVESIVLHTSHHTHRVIGSGANDPQKYDPAASRETLDHSIPYIVAVALQDGEWHHERSYAPERAARADTVRLWRSISTVEDPEWTRRYHSLDPHEQAFGGRMVVERRNSPALEATIAVADAHPLGVRPFARPDYVGKFLRLSDGIVDDVEAARFLGLVERLPELSPDEVAQLTVTPRAGYLDDVEVPGGLF